MEHPMLRRVSSRGLSSRVARTHLVWAASFLIALLPSVSRCADIIVDYSGDRPLILAQGEAPRRDCSLREAINNSDNRTASRDYGCAAGTGDDVIVFFPGLAEVGLDTGSFGVLSIKSNTALQVRGHAYNSRVTINGQYLGPLFDIDNTNAHIEFKNIRFSSGMREGAGGAILQKGGTLVLSGCRFDANAAVNGGALAVAELDTRLFINDCVFHSNVAYGTPNSSIDGWGGALWFNGGSAEIRRTTFSDNKARLSGGAVECSSDGSMEIFGSVVGPSMIGSNNSFFYRNQTLLANADLNGSAGGGALSSGECYLIVADTRFDENVTVGKGGAAYIRSNATSAYFHNVAFEGNVASASAPAAGYGAAAAVEGKTTFNRISAADNKADFGGAFLVRGITGTGYATFVNSTIWRNRAARNLGAGFYFTGPLQENKVAIRNSTLDDNEGGEGGSTLFFDSNINAPVAFENNILQARNGTPNCAGKVDAQTFNSIEGQRSIQFDFSAMDTCDVGLAARAIPKLDAGFLFHGVLALRYPFAVHSSINTFSPATWIPGANATTCETSGKSWPPTVVVTSGRDQTGKVRDQAHCTMGAVEPIPVVAVDDF